ncbi:hypothetical protein [Myceligenerans indicum]|uniref:hypothetical protein n=1 Tax=Myceligenerans indicum TaxID=2593663 RepID=UPI00191CE816|nr:hypothetical protein [Myceligenerans indicum]
MGFFDAAKNFVTDPANIARAKALATDENVDLAARKLKELAPEQVRGAVDGLAAKAKEWGGPDEEPATSSGEKAPGDKPDEKAPEEKPDEKAPEEKAPEEKAAEPVRAAESGSADEEPSRDGDQDKPEDANRD